MSEGSGLDRTPGSNDDAAELTGDDQPASSEDGESVGAADRAADIERSS